MWRKYFKFELKNNRANGKDSINSELIKYGDQKLWNRIHQLITTIWNIRSHCSHFA
jgi:hypothetical protein